jgi:hypothetical protein
VRQAELPCIHFGTSLRSSNQTKHGEKIFKKIMKKIMKPRNPKSEKSEEQKATHPNKRILKSDKDRLECATLPLYLVNTLETLRG